MLTRCPHCQTVFRALQEQLSTHGGQVRCGACHHPFNAHAHFVKEEEDLFLFAWNEDAPQSILPPTTLDTILSDTPDSSPGISPADAAASILPEEDTPPATTPILDPIDELLAAEAASRNKPGAQTAEAIRQQGLENGLVAARHAQELPGFSSWGTAPLEASSPQYPLWPFVLTAIFFALLLSLQALLFFRSEVSQSSPSFASLFQTLGVDIPLAREPEHLFIEGSELQTLEAPDRLRLFVTLRNKAHYALAWPHLELSLTDPYNMVLVRKVLPPGEYLSREQAESAFKPGATLIRLDLGARAIAPSGYNLYLFYP